MNKHNIPKFTSVGSYPLCMVRKGRVFCVRCANELETQPTDIIDANWENPALYCDECEERIESAYAEHLVSQQQHQQRQR